MGKENKSKITIFTLLPATVMPMLAIGTIKLIRFYNIKKNKRTKTLSLDGISHPISLEQLEKFESFSDCIISGDVHYQKNGGKHIEISYSGKQFAGNKCCKKFFFCNKQLSICNFIFDNLSAKSESNKIYKELTQINGKPDKVYYDKKICRSQYIWHGRNGQIAYYKFHDSLIVIVFEINMASDNIDTK